jgi:NF-X1-type zinc finger protein NFXL1
MVRVTHASQEWGRNQLEAAAAKAARLDPSTAAAAGARAWGCPKCRHSYSGEQLPRAYTCLCGRKEEPEWDPWLAPHTCGELCGK